MTIKLGVDTLSYYCRIAEGHISVEDVLKECATLDADFVQVTAGHVRGWSDARLENLRGEADELGLGLTLGGGPIGQAGRGDVPQQGADRIAGMAHAAERLGSPYVVTFAGFYRSELWRIPEQIERERRYLVEALHIAASGPDGPAILLENHSDFTSREYEELLAEVASPRVALFLDLINPVSTLDDPLTTARSLAPYAPAGHVKDFRLESCFVGYGSKLRRGFDVRWCYPGEGVADLSALLDVIVMQPRDDAYYLSIEGLDNHGDVADQKERLSQSLSLLRQLLDVD
ncbi:sugar phosphate isomerase/epimerase family protein [Streptomyces chartreusis]|uniref:sugar phosphate isomerase/epimerase family protein n=1 Tax=Streptomyces chartreusis TaxID=1969 RepID=UPI00371E4010